MDQLFNKPHKIIAFLIWTLWIPVILFCSHLIISGRNGSVFSFVLLCFALLFVLLCIGRLSKYLENTIAADTNYIGRISRQFVYGFLAPLSSIIISATVCDEFIDDYVIQRLHLIKELSVIVLFLYVTNSFYLVIYMDRQFSRSTVQIEETECYHEKVLVYHKGAYVPVNLMEIALIYQRGQINWLITFGEEEHILDLSLKTIHEILSVKKFFKINRSQIVHKDVIDKFKPGSFGKINLVLKINAITTTVSKDRAKDFRKWFYK